MGPLKESHARQAQTIDRPAQPNRRGKRKAPETTTEKPEIHNQRGEQKMEHVSDDVRPQALALMSAALSRQSFARSPDTKSKPEPHQKHQGKQRPENGVKYFFGVHTDCPESLASWRQRTKPPMPAIAPPIASIVGGKWSALIASASPPSASASGGKR